MQQEIKTKHNNLNNKIMDLEDKLHLENKLQEIYERYQALDSTQNRGTDFMNCIIELLKERLNKRRYTYNQGYWLLTQIDRIWRSFAKKNNLNPDFFRHNYIIPRCSKMFSGKAYFKITEQELEKYGQN